MEILSIGAGLLIFLSGCAGVVVTDHEWYGSLGVEGAAGFHTLTDETETLDLEHWAARWDDLTHPLVCTDTGSFAEIKADLEKLCSFEPCTVKMKEAVDALYAKVKAANVAAARAANRAEP